MFKSLFKKKDNPKGGRITLVSPTRGKAIKLEEVPDEVFAQKMLGEGFAIEPLEGAVYSPVDGEIKVLFPTLHAVAIETDEGLELLIHIGIDTVELNGEGFKSNIQLGDRVKKGDLLINFNLELIEEKGKSPITPIIITNMDRVKNLEFQYGDKDLGDDILNIELK